MIRLDLDNRDVPPDGGFELGHVTVSCGEMVHSSRAAGSRGLVMIYLAATDLLDGARLLLADPGSGYVFTGAGSGWSFTVRRARRGGLEIATAAGSTLGVVSERDYLLAVWSGVERLIVGRPPGPGAAWSDLSAARDAFPAAYKSAGV